ncbi:two component transcriptional regulator, AraC family [Terribacillus aidingensis]|uniref:Two component transcriptional regulator, AraC family n=1 Tax=Terribacillus aidingensis TaxID=586416 RepID=A0A285NYQ3_9BACI|nr:response regulator transcription factor [Terribacillus aidingensis]SNZ14157.1 two component transcriptional regulator, AraC family [Terribacillus aidingensis]
MELCKILIVDDEILIRQGIKYYIDWEKEGFSIVGEASNGQEALELIEKLRPHIVVTDVVMPIMDGEALTRAVKKQYSHIGLIVLSSFSEFDYVRNAFQNGVVDYILKPKLNAESLLKALRQAAGKLDDVNLNNNEAHEQTLNEKLRKLYEGKEINIENETAANFPGNFFQVISYRYKADQDAASVFGAIEGKDGSLTTLLSSANYHLYLWNGKKTLVKDSFSGLLKTGTVCSTNSFLHLSELKGKQKELEKIEGYRFFFPDSSFLSDETLPPPPRERRLFQLDYFIDACKMENFREAFSYLEEHLERMALDYQQDVDEYKAFLNNILFNLLVLLGNLKYQIEVMQAKKYLYFQQISRAADVYTANEIVTSFLIDAEGIVKKEEEEQGHMRKLTDYIKAHYHESLSLTDIAQHFHFSPSYLSNYFSTHSKEGFSEYLNRIRIEAAIVLLRQNDIPISKVSEQVGFSDHSYFCRVFKKQTGYSPSQYRRKRITP